MRRREREDDEKKESAPDTSVVPLPHGSIGSDGDGADVDDVPGHLVSGLGDEGPVVDLGGNVGGLEAARVVNALVGVGGIGVNTADLDHVGEGAERVRGGGGGGGRGGEGEGEGGEEAHLAMRPPSQPESQVPLMQVWSQSTSCCSERETSLLPAWAIRMERGRGRGGGGEWERRTDRQEPTGPRR